MLIDPYRFGDPNFDAVVTLLTGNTGSIVEWSGATTVNVEGSAGLSTGQVKFGTHSIRNPDVDSPVDATDGVVITDAVNTTRFTFPAEFTIEGWFFPVDATTDADQSMLIGNDAAIAAERFVFDARTDVSLGDQGRLRFRSGNTTVVQSAAGALVEGAWQHLAVTRDTDGIVRIFVNGVTVATSSTFTDSIGGVDINGDANLKVTIGIAFVVGDLDTYFDQIRVTAGVCRYDANFTPPTEPFPTG
jgi:hypothetical protein